MDYLIFSYTDKINDKNKYDKNVLYIERNWHKINSASSKPSERFIFYFILNSFNFVTVSYTGYFKVSNKIIKIYLSVFWRFSEYI